jgi:hypothetical protein
VANQRFIEVESCRKALVFGSQLFGLLRASAAKAAEQVQGPWWLGSTEFLVDWLILIK